MKITTKMEEYRFRDGDYGSDPGDQSYGAFFMPGPCGSPLMIIATTAVNPMTKGWEHVSVSLDRRLPNWIEMSYVKDLFWEPEDVVVQFHPAKSQYINCHPNCLHLWKFNGPMPMPPPILVGLKS
jgi:hypothetical protein